MRIRLTTVLNCPKERAWQAVQTTRLLEYIAAPLVRFDPLQPSRLPETWVEGSYQVRMKIFGWFSFGKHWIVISKPQAENGPYHIRDNGYGDHIKKWDHWINIQDALDEKTLYTDQVDIEAGLLTPVVWLFSQVFYRYRQRRWRELVKNNFQYRR
ncbi:MAG: hypothetical protein AB1649_28620 [Chloroflexota bacterium]|jgi:hypothetical protein|nr:hypothetical protein [Chloroflexota bacterium]